MATKANEKQINGDHYKSMSIQPSEFIVRNNIPWLEANAIKYLCRHSKKGGIVDLEKAKHYIELAMDEYYTNKPVAPAVVRDGAYDNTPAIYPGDVWT